MEIREENTLSVLNDLFQYADKKETVRIYSRNRHENHQVKWLLQGENLQKTIRRFPAGDLYISFNTFKNTSRKAKSATKNALFNVYNFCIDVDYKAGIDRNVPIEQAIFCITELWNSSFGNSIPMPSYIEYGNQFRLIYCIKGHLGTERQFQAIELVAKKIVHILNSCPDFDYHAEMQPLNSYIRFPGSFNMKKNAEQPIIRFMKVCPVIDGYEIDMDTRRTLGEYMDEVLGEWEKPDWYEQWQKSDKKKKKKHTRSLKELNHSRMEDITKIQKYYIKEGEIGHRDKLCFAYYLHAKHYFDKPDAAIAALHAFNQAFPCPLSDGKLENCICTAIHKNYRMKSTTLLEFLDITSELADVLGLNLTTSVNNADRCKAYRIRQKKAKKRRGQLRSQKTEKIKKNIIAMRKHRVPTGRIAVTLGLSIKTVERYIAVLIKERRLLKMKVVKKCDEIIQSKQKDSTVPSSEEEKFLRDFVRSVEIIGRACTSEKTEAQIVRELELFDAAYRVSGLAGE